MGVVTGVSPHPSSLMNSLMSTGSSTGSSTSLATRDCSSTLSCSYCSFCSSDNYFFIKHLFLAHCSECTFFVVCGISSCRHEFKTGASFSSYLSHCNQKHCHWKEVLSKSADFEIINTSGAILLASNSQVHCHREDIIDNAKMGTTVECNSIHKCDSNENHNDLPLVAARFLINLKEKYKLTQSSLNFILDSVVDIITIISKSIEKSVQERIGQSAYSDLSLSTCFTVLNPFANLMTEYQQTQFYKENLGLVVSYY